MSVEVNALGDLGEAATSWRELAQRSRNPFATWEWARTWWSHFGAGEDLRLFSCRPSAGDPVAILPLSRSRLGPLRALRVIGHGPSDQLTPVCADADRELALAGLAEAIGSMDDWDLFLGERIPESWPIEEALATRPLGKESNPALLIGGRSWDDILAERSKGFRGQVRRYERRLVRELGLRFRLTSSPDRLGEDMDLLFALHSARWGPGTTRFPALAAFHRDFAAVALEQGWLRLWVAEVGDRPAAAWYGFRYAGVSPSTRPAATRTSNAGRSDSCSSTTPSARRCRTAWTSTASCGVERATKARYTDVDRTLQTVAHGRTPLGRLAVASAAGLAGRPRARALIGKLAR